ncbi:unnamed protein product [Ceratitis capitata]|uniref:Elongator complex protein 6 n=1 Tax=Ceratitis capitata TaxID=7213 RepID=A0A811U5U0_CERCA|nr:unnamed protein product [Ceratitis capitata]
MAASVLFICGLTDKVLPKFVHISEEANMDGSFLFSCLLRDRLRITNTGTVLVCLQQNFQHYFNAGMRLGYNAKIFLDRILNVVDPLTDMAQKGMKSKWLRDERLITTYILNDICEYISETADQRVSTTIMIDNLAVLLNLGATKEEILQLCYQLVDLPKQYDNLSVITKISNCDLNEAIDNNLAKLSNAHIRVAPFKTPVSRVADGKLLIQREALYQKARQEDEQGRVQEIDDREKRIVCAEVMYKAHSRCVKIMFPCELEDHSDKNKCYVPPIFLVVCKPVYLSVGFPSNKSAVNPTFLPGVLYFSVI